MLNKITLVPVLLTGSIIATFIPSSSIGTSIASLGLAALYGFSLFLQTKKEPIANKDLIDRIVSLEEKLSTTNNKLGAISLSNQFQRK